MSEEIVEEVILVDAEDQNISKKKRGRSAKRSIGISRRGKSNDHFGTPKLSIRNARLKRPKSFDPSSRVEPSSGKHQRRGRANSPLVRLMKDSKKTAQKYYERCEGVKSLEFHVTDSQECPSSSFFKEKEEKAVSASPHGAKNMLSNLKPQRRTSFKNAAEATSPSTTAGPRLLEEREGIKHKHYNLHKQLTSKKAVLLCATIFLTFVFRVSLLLPFISVLIIYGFSKFLNKWVIFFNSENESVSLMRSLKSLFQCLGRESEKMLQGDTKRLALLGYLVFAEDDGSPTSSSIYMRQRHRVMNNTAVMDMEERMPAKSSAKAP